MTYEYRKKPVVIEAFEMSSEFWDSENSDHPDWAQEAVETGQLTLEDGRVLVMTLEDGKDNIAKHVADFGDWIIRGVQGELYPIKPDIFEMTYEKVQ